MNSSSIYVYMLVRELSDLLIELCKLVPCNGFAQRKGGRDFQVLCPMQDRDAICDGAFSIVFLREDSLDTGVPLVDYESAPTFYGFMDIIVPQIFPNGFQSDMMASMRPTDTMKGIKPPDRLFKEFKRLAYKISEKPLCDTRNGKVASQRRYTTAASDLARAGVRMGGATYTYVPCDEL